eukprot:2771241-Prymnesium_polylepis.2
MSSLLELLLRSMSALEEITCNKPTSSTRTPCLRSKHDAEVSAIETSSSSSPHALKHSISIPRVLRPLEASSAAALAHWRGTYSSMAWTPASLVVGELSQVHGVRSAVCSKEDAARCGPTSESRRGMSTVAIYDATGGGDSISRTFLGCLHRRQLSKSGGLQPRLTCRARVIQCDKPPRGPRLTGLDGRGAIKACSHRQAEHVLDSAIRLMREPAPKRTRFTAQPRCWAMVRIRAGVRIQRGIHQIANCRARGSTSKGAAELSPPCSLASPIRCASPSPTHLSFTEN